LRRPDPHETRRRRVPGPETEPWLNKFYSVNDDWLADDRRRLLAFARGLLNSDYAAHGLTFQLFAQLPPYAHLAAVYGNFDWDGALDFVKKAAGLCERVDSGSTRHSGDRAVRQWFGS
jgi:4-hydroxyphenylacetate 3-monooxygenase